MNITSLLITLAGIIFIIALYIISRVSQSKLPRTNTSILPNLKDDDGNQFSSVLDDIPAQDGSTPTPESVATDSMANKSIASEAIVDADIDADKIKGESHQQLDPDDIDNGSNSGNGNGNDDDNSNKNSNLIKEENDSQPAKAEQHILFITGKNDDALDGSLVHKALKKNGLVLGDMDIYHYFPVMKDALPKSDKYSLFRIANGVAPWTLKPEDLHGKKLAGLSLVMTTPTKINDSEAIALFIALSEKICKQINGTLKNQQQQLFTDKEKKNLLTSYKN